VQPLASRQVSRTKTDFGANVPPGTRLVGIESYESTLSAGCGIATAVRGLRTVESD